MPAVQIARLKNEVAKLGDLFSQPVEFKHRLDAMLEGKGYIKGSAILISGMVGTGKTSLAESAAIVSRTAVLISGDSGVLHIGVGLGRATVSLFGPGISEKWAPRGAHHRAISRGYDCSPCTRYGYTPRCLHAARCIRDITVAEVLTAVMELYTHEPRVG